MTVRRSLRFDPNAYRLLYPDVSDLTDALAVEHYEQHGLHEGRCPSALFNPSYYASQVGVLIQSASDYYINLGRKHGDPHPLFDVTFYARQAGDTSDPVQHYIEEGWQRGLDPHPLFSTTFYLRQSADILSSGYDPLSDFILTGWRQGRNPNALFHTNHYLERSPDVLSADVNPLMHYVMHGWKERRSHHPLFDGHYYAEQIPDNIDPLSHYLHEGCRLGYDPHPLFSTDYYLLHSPDLVETDINPLDHFCSFGGQELRPHHPLFDPQWYRHRTACTGIPLIDYLESGGVHDPSPLFNSRWYLEHVPGARQSESAPLIHWVLKGARNGNAFSSLPLQASVLDMMSTGNVVGASILLRSRLASPFGAPKRQVVVPLQVNMHEQRVQEGYVIGGLSGVISADGQFMVTSTVDRPQFVQLDGNAVVIRDNVGMALVEHTLQVSDQAVTVADDFNGNDWDWCTRRLPALSELAGSERIIISRQLGTLTLSLTRRMLAPHHVTILKSGSAMRVTDLRIIPAAEPEDCHREPHEAPAGIDRVLLILDERDPFDDEAKAALVSAINRVGGRVIDSSWGIPLIEESVASSTRLIAAAALPVVSYLARSGSTVVPLLNDCPNEHMDWLKRSGLVVEAVVLGVAETSQDHLSPTLLDPQPHIESILGSIT